MKLRRFITWMLLIALLTAVPSLAESVVGGTLTLPASMLIVKDEAFMGVMDVNNVVIPEGTMTIGARAFANSSVKSVTLPASLTFIANDAFSGCTGLVVEAVAGTYAYEWAKRMGYAVGAAHTGPVITGSGWSGSMIEADIVVYRRSNQGRHEDIWWWDFCREYFKIDFNVTQTTSASDYKAIAFMGGEMPDVFYQMFMSSNQQTEMGDMNGFLLNLKPYITSSQMPNLTRILNAIPGAREQLTTQRGAIYGLGAFNNPNDSNMKFYINQRWLDEAGLALPTTLDEFELVLSEFKKRGSGVVPMCNDYNNAPRYLANAMGWVTNSASYLTSAALRKGNDGKYHTDFIYSNREVYPEFLKIMKRWYNAGYFSPNLFNSLVASEEVNALKRNDLTGFDQSYSNTLNSDEWTAVRFLTSDWNGTSQVGRTYNAMSNQSFSLASDVSSSKISRLMKWADWHYDYDNYLLSHSGPSAQDTEWLFDLQSGWTATKVNGRYEFTCAEVESGVCSSFGDYQNKYVQGIIGGYLGLGYDLFGDTKFPYNGTGFSHGENTNVLPYIVEPYPQITFFSISDVEKTSALSAAINTYVNEMYQKFVTGKTAINSTNLNAYFSQLDRLGFQEYKKIYYNYYERRYN